MIVFFFLAAILVGMGQPIQAGVNAQLRSYLGDPAWATMVSVLGSCLCITVYILVRRVPVPPASSFAQVPWWGWTGGIFGVTFVVATLLVTPRLGAGLTYALIIGGQVLISLALDQWGLIGLPIHHAGPLRILGALLLVAGVLLIRSF